MKPGTLLAYHPHKWNPENRTWFGILLEYHPASSPNIAWIRILWDEGKVDEVNWGYTGYERDWEILS